MPLILTLRTPSAIPLEVDSIQLDVVRGQSAAEVAATPIHRGNTEIPLGEFFDVTGSAADDSCLIWRGDCSKVKLIGTHWKSGYVRVEGDAGMHLGAEMTGGEILCTGNAADWVGAEMKGGRITVLGNAGHLVGAVYRGGHRGMTGGEILIHGQAGNEVGHTMRRGLIAVGGELGDVAGLGMIAGTILAFGKVGIRQGAGMKRGTIALLGDQPTPDILPTFREGGTFRPSFLPLFGKHLQALGFPLPENMPLRCRRFWGDFLELGKGEILLPELA